jgi:hypothetical protein
MLDKGKQLEFGKWLQQIAVTKLKASHTCLGSKPLDHSGTHMTLSGTAQQQGLDGNRQGAKEASSIGILLLGTRRLQFYSARCFSIPWYSKHFSAVQCHNFSLW